MKINELTINSLTNCYKRYTFIKNYIIALVLEFFDL